MSYGINLSNCIVLQKSQMANDIDSFDKSGWSKQDNLIGIFLIMYKGDNLEKHIAHSLRTILFLFIFAIIINHLYIILFSSYLKLFGKMQSGW
jgi:hypothetical protein